MELTQKLLKEQVVYNKNTGIFTRKVKTSKANIGDKITRTTNRGYIQFSVLGKLYLGHRLAWLYEYGHFPEKHLDHINHDKTDNRIYNLREVTNQDNHKNRTKQSNNTSGINGVYYRKDRNKWTSMITINGKIKCLGYFKDKEDAIKVRKEAEIENKYHINHGA